MTDSPDILIGAAPSGRGFRLETSQVLPASREELFQFFADARQLETITPPWLSFSVLTPPPIEMAAGTLIDYRLKLHFLPIRWRTRISVWEPPVRFVDEQLRGPYRRWHHEHVFEPVEGGTRCRDVVDFEVPGGRLIESIFVRPDLQRIFAYRQKKLGEIFASRV